MPRKPKPGSLKGSRFFQDEAFPLAVHRVEVTRDVEPHGHDFVEIVYIEKGSAKHRVAGTQDHEASFDIMAGDVFVIAPKEVHAFHEPKDLSVVNVLFRPELLKSEFAELRSVPGLLEFLVTEPLFRYESEFRYKLQLESETCREIECLLARVESEIEQKHPGWQVSARSCFLDALIRLARAFAGNRQTGEQRDLEGKQEAVGRAVQFIEERFAEDISLDSIAHQVYLSPNYFSDLFRKTTGLSPWEYVTRMRIDRSRDLLRTTGKSITEIAFEVGFGDSSYFARVFKDRVGATPREYRKTGESSGKT